MKQKYKQKKSLREIDSKRKWSGETSPYWDFMERKSRHNEFSDGIIEDPIANPDVLSEDDHLYHRPLSEEGEEQFQFIRKQINTLTLQQQQVLQLYGFEGLTLKQTAKELQLSISTVHEYLRAIRKKLRINYFKAKSTPEK